jgi:hypothetical protein
MGGLSLSALKMREDEDASEHFKVKWFPDLRVCGGALSDDTSQIEDLQSVSDGDLLGDAS